MQALRQLFTCSITQEITLDPFVLRCGHLFDSEAIRTWTMAQQTLCNTCPVCRRPYSLMVNHMGSILSAAAAIAYDSQQEESGDASNQSVTTDQSTQTEHTDTATSTQTEHVDDDIVMEVENLPLPPFVAYLDGDHFDPNLVDVLTRDYIARDQVVNLGVNTFNPYSSNRRISEIVERLNENYVRSRITVECSHPCMVVRKYCYHSLETSPCVVALQLARRGYYIYDIFEIRRARPGRVNTFVVYTPDRLDNGSVVCLSRFNR